MAYTYPILLDLTARRILLVGGGRVAARKAAGLLEAGATDIHAISPAFITDFPTGTQRTEGPYRPEVLEGADLVFAATDQSTVNDQVIADAQRLRIWASRADSDDDNPGSFITPARLIEGPVIVTVSAGSAALAVRVRDGLRERWDARWTAMATAMQSLRPWIRDQSGLTPAQRAVIFRRLACDDALDLLATRGPEALRAWLIEEYPPLAAGGKSAPDRL